MCTRVLWNTNEIAVLTGRTMDWPESTEPLIVAFPRGLDRDGGLMHGEVVVLENPLRWTSTHASLATTVYGIGTVDGLNEAGFAVHALYLKTTDVGVRDPNLAGLHIGLWAQYLLDRASTVSEALALMDGFQLVMVSAHGFEATMHLAIEDVSGDSAILEFDAGEIVVHHGREFRLMTNDPTYDEQLKLLSAQDFSHPSSEMQPARQRQRRRPLPTGRLLLGAAPRARRRAPGRRRRDGHHAQRVGAVRRAVRRVRRLQHRIPHRLRSDQPDLLLRADDEPERHLGPNSTRSTSTMAEARWPSTRTTHRWPATSPSYSPRGDIGF